MARRLVTSSMTSHDSGVILMTSQSLKTSHSETRTRTNYPCGPFNHTLSWNIVLNMSSFALELWEKKHLVRPHSDSNSSLFTTSACYPLPCSTIG